MAETGARAKHAASLVEVAREWGRLGLIGFGGPAAHIALLRRLCVERRGWLSEEQFERAVGATALLPGPSSTQLAVYCARWVRGPAGGLVGGLAFVLPAVAIVLALASVFLAAAPPRWLLGAAAGAGAAVAAVALRAGIDIGAPLIRRAQPRMRLWIVGYALAGALVAALAGQWVVLVLAGCGLAELMRRRRGAGPPRAGRERGPAAGAGVHAWPLLGLLATRGGLGALSWTALKVGALSFGGGFVIVPLMQRDAVDVYHWMSGQRFLDAVALGQVTPGPVVATIAAVGYAAHGVGGGLLAAAVAFAPSFAFVLGGSGRLERLRGDHGAHVFIAGAAPAAVGAILGAAIPLAAALREGWQFALLATAAFVLLVLRRGVVATLLGAAAVGVLVVVVLGAPAPR